VVRQHGFDLTDDADYGVMMVTVAQAMLRFCATCQLCGPPLMDSYPQCLEAGDPTPGGNGPFCERCRDEFRRLYDDQSEDELVFDEGRKEHEHAMFICCLTELTAQVAEYACDTTELTPDQVAVLFELLIEHVEEGWEPFTEDIIAPEDPHAEPRADFEADVMSDLLRDQCDRGIAN